MATIVRDKNRATGKPNGCRTLQFIDPEGKRRGIRLGKVTAKGAETIKSNVESIMQADMAQVSWDREVTKWVGDLNPAMYDKLATAGLLPKRKLPEASLLAAFLDSFIANQKATVKDSTAVVYGHTRRCLVEFFGVDCAIEDITPGDADEFRAWLTTSQGLASNTVRRRCGIARQFFRSAVRKKLLTENPFADMNEGVAVRANKSRDYFVTREDAAAVLAACPDDEWRLLFALCRYGALRCPSEVLALTWADVDWEQQRITVRSPKTEHHEGKEFRVIPLFDELREYLETAFDSAPDGTVYVIRTHRNANHRTRLEKIIGRAGLNPWPKLFQNLRATRATELAADFPAHVAAEWTGHSQKIAEKHYWRVTEADFAKALEKCKQKCKQHTDAPNSTAETLATSDIAISAVIPSVPHDAYTLVGDEGLEPPTSTL